MAPWGLTVSWVAVLAVIGKQRPTFAPLLIRAKYGVPVNWPVAHAASALVKAVALSTEVTAAAYTAAG